MHHGRKIVARASRARTTERRAISGVSDAGMRLHPGLTKSQRRNLRRSAARAAVPQPAFEQYYHEQRPATAMPFRESINAWRAMELTIDDTWEALGRLSASLGVPRSPRSEERNGRGEVWIARADRHRARHPFVAWRAALVRARAERATLGGCFAAWAWHPDGALVGSLARRHGDAFGGGAPGGDD